MLNIMTETDSYHPEDEPVANPSSTAIVPFPPSAATEIPGSAVPPTTSSVPSVGQTPTPTVIQDYPFSPTPSIVSPGGVTETAIGTAVPTGTADFPTQSSQPTDALTETPVSTDTQAAGTPSEQPSPTETSTPTSDGTGSPTAIPTDLTGTPVATGTIVASPTESAVPTTPVPDALQPLHVGNELIVKIDPQQREAALQTLKSLGLVVIEDTGQTGATETVLVKVDPTRLDDMLVELGKAKGIDYAEPNYLAGISSLPSDASQPNDPLFPKQNDLQQIQVPQAWSTLKALPQDQQVIVAVLDTGVNVSHPDLVNNIWQNPGETGQTAAGQSKSSNGVDDDQNGYVDDWQGWNFVAGNNDVRDDNGHGTHLAGIIAASVNNAIGIAGIAPNAHILPVKVLDANGYGTYTNIADGIIYATNMGARIINLGFGGTGSSKVMQDAVNYAILHNVLVVAAAGNSGDTTTYYPAGYSGVVAVSAADNNEGLASFSSTGDDVSLTAPGVGILSTGPAASYVTMSGTSMAAAQVSGVAALLAGQTKFFNIVRLRSSMLGGALDLGVSGVDHDYGYGMLQAVNALSYSGPLIPLTISLDGTPYVVTGGVNILSAPPIVTITAPTVLTYAEGTLIKFVGTAEDADGKDLSSAMVWYSNLTGPIGTGASVSTSNLMPGTHTITAQATDSVGQKGISSPLTITITGASGPHANAYGNTDQCAVCHRTHSLSGDAYLTTDPKSVLTSDAFCLSCHTNVSTHSNKGWTGAVEPQFNLRCIQCHDPHGTSNLFDIRPNLITNLSPQTTVGPITFTSLTGPNSYDDGASTNRLCMTCHTSVKNHPGGLNHYDGTGFSINYTGLSCVACHPHNADANIQAFGGFMPIRTPTPTPSPTPSPTISPTP